MAKQKKSYWEQLQDPRWQRKRLEVMERDDWTCVECGAKDVTLNVHHTYYLDGYEPWSYPTDSLKTLCKDCHNEVSQMVKAIRNIAGGLPVWALYKLRGYAVSALLPHYEIGGTIEIGCDDELYGVIDAAQWTIPLEEMESLVKTNDEGIKYLNLDDVLAKFAEKEMNSIFGAKPEEDWSLAASTG